MDYTRSEMVMKITKDTITLLSQYLAYDIIHIAIFMYNVIQ